MEHLARFYLNWRRRALPPSVADIEWRHDLVAGRLDEMAGRLDEIGPALMLLHAPTAEEQRDVLEVLRMLEPVRVEGFEKIRVGAAGDGGYVQISDLDGITQALSFGIADEDSWDLAMAQAGVPVQQLDHSVERAPSTHPLLTFHRKMIGTQSSAESATLAELVAAYSKGGAPDIILKIDIEGCEWEVFAEADDATLGRITQIVCELHELSHLGKSALSRASSQGVVQSHASFRPRACPRQQQRQDLQCRQHRHSRCARNFLR